MRRSRRSEEQIVGEEVDQPTWPPRGWLLCGEGSFDPVSRPHEAEAIAELSCPTKSGRRALQAPSARAALS